MSEDFIRHKWRFSLKGLILAVASLSVFLAATLSGARVQEMGRSGIYGHHYGWPVPYLRVPTGVHAGKISSDLFLPGLIIDLALAFIFVAAIHWLWAIASRPR